MTLLSTRRLTSLLGLLLFATFAFTQNQETTALDFQPPENPLEIIVAQTTEAIKIDGELNELVWKDAEVIKDFFRREPRQGGAIKFKTEVRFLYDDKYLYIGAICYDSLGAKGVRIQDLRRDFD